MTKRRWPRTEPWGTPQRQGEVVIAFDTKTARGQIGPKPVKSSALNAEPRRQTSE